MSAGQAPTINRDFMLSQTAAEEAGHACVLSGLCCGHVLRWTKKCSGPPQASCASERGGAGTQTIRNGEASQVWPAVTPIPCGVVRSSADMAAAGLSGQGLPENGWTGEHVAGGVMRRCHDWRFAIAAVCYRGA